MMTKSFSIFLLSLTLFLGSCGKTAQEEIDAEKNSAELDLTKGDCDGALSKLQGVGMQNDDARYLVLLASAYACKAGYTSTVFFTSDIPLVAGTNLLSEFAQFTTSDLMTTTTDADYTNIKSAIEVLLYAGGISTSTNPTSALRNAEFSSKESAQIHSLLMFLLMVNLGQYNYFYGNTDATGVKGGPAGNDCFMDYTNSTAVTANGALGNCNAENLGNPLLDDGGTFDYDLLCEGIVLFNSFFEVFPEVIDGAVGGDLGSLPDFTTVIDDIKTDLTGAGVSTTILDTTSQTRCLADITDDTTIELYFYFTFEALHNKT